MKRWLIGLVAGTMCLAGALAQEGGAVGAEQAKAAWSDEMRGALGFEAARWWDGGETVAEPRKGGQAAIRWARHRTNGSLACRLAPLDLSAFNTLSFWLHSSHANGETFMIIAESQRQEGVFSYYSRVVTVDWVGWKQLTAHFRSFGGAREPAGWGRISRFRLSATGWNQNPSGDSVWVLDDLDFGYDPRPYRPPIRVDKYVDEPAPEEFLARLRREHPRLILTDEGLVVLRRRIAEDPVCRAWYETIRRDAAALADKPVRKHELPGGKRLLSVSRDVLNRLYHWALLYRMEADRKWLDRAWREMEAVVAFPDWNPSHYLDTAEMMHALAVGYDWLYHGLTAEQRTIIREGLWRHGLRLSHAAYLGLKAEGQQGWLGVTNNWNFVCNGGSGLAAMALLDELPEPCTEVLHAGFQYIQLPLRGFEPDGAWWEGVGYWGYSMHYLVAWLRGLETAFGTDFGLTAALAGKGFAKSGDFPIYLTSPRNGFFNFADSGSGGSGYRHWAFFYLAARYRNPLYLHYQRERASGGVEDLLYYEPFASGLELKATDRDRHFRGAEVATLRGSWTDPNATFVGLKSGRNGIAHAHQDLGSFVFYALGEKWVMDLGTEGQTYQAHKHHLPNWHFYRIRAEGHNTLVINPTFERAQNPKGASTITRFETSAGEAYAVTDLTDVYRDHATSVVRGLRLFDQRRVLLVQDELRTDRDMDLWWFAHGDAGTRMELEAAGREVVMERNGRLCRAALLAPAEARFELLPARPLAGSPDPDIQQKNAGVQKLAVHLPRARDVRLAVLFSARYAHEPEPTTRPEVTPLADWRLPPVEAPRLAGLEVGGRALAEFTPTVFDYTVVLPDGGTTPPAVAALPGETGAKVTVVPAAGVPGTARVTVAAARTTALYQVRFLPPTPLGVSDKPQFAVQPARVGAITVTASRHDGNLPVNVLDDDPATRWSAHGEEEWLALDFGQPRRLEAVQIAWFNGHQRRTRFRIETSPDGRRWRAVYQGESSGKSADLETYRLGEPATDQHLRIVSLGNSDNLWNSISTVRLEP